jgi:hypothetical protein
VVRHHESLPDAIRDKTSWYRLGPNGPVREAQLYRDGELVDPWAEIERCGYAPLVHVCPYTGRERLVSCE